MDNDHLLVILDTETTGTHKNCEIVEIGMLECRNQELTGNTFHNYYNPRSQVKDGAVKVHGLTQEFLGQHASLDEEQMHKILSFIGTSMVAAHNATFDTMVLNYHMHHLNFKYSFQSIFCNRIIDTMAMARNIIKARSHSLDSLCQHFNIDLSPRAKFHGALIDCYLTYELYKKLVAIKKDMPCSHELSYDALENKIITNASIKRLC